MRSAAGFLVVSLIALAGGLLLPIDASAQVYKCRAKDGTTMYSQNPCSPDAQPMDLRTQKASALSTGEQNARRDVFRSTDLSDVALRERSCLDTANENIYGPSNSRIAGYQRQIERLNADLATKESDLASATAANGMRQQIAGLQQSIANEGASADAQMNSARTRCADERHRAEEAVEKRYAPAPL